MEYTKDLILNIRYDESSNTLNLGSLKWTSRFIQKIKKHKLALTISAMFLTFVVMDVMLVTNFMHILARTV
jgi:hypothetical protein